MYANKLSSLFKHVYKPACTQLNISMHACSALHAVHAGMNISQHAC